jgi:hypothetical protein
VIIAAALLASACGPRTTAPTAAPMTPPAAAPSESAAPPTVASAPAAGATPEPTPAASLPPPTTSGVHPLTAEQRRIFWDTPEDRPATTRGGLTKELVDKQYLAGNEKTLNAFKPAIEGIGGGYVGVGSDQAYFFIGWARPEFAWLVDYDADVKAIHAVYRAFFEAASEPAAFMALWEKDTRKASAQRIMVDGDPDETRRLRKLYLGHRGWIERRLVAQHKRMSRAKIASWLTDQETYAFVRDLVLADRVRPMVANLLEPGAMRQVTASARELDVPIHIVYLSNAEQYWESYPNAFRETIFALPRDDKSLLLRTLLIWDVNRDYRYNTQQLGNFETWLREPWIRNVNDITHSRADAVADAINVFETGGSPADSPRARAVARE